MTKQEEHVQYKDAIEDLRKSHDAVLGHLEKRRRGIPDTPDPAVAATVDALLFKHSPNNPNKPVKDGKKK